MRVPLKKRAPDLWVAEDIAAKTPAQMREL
jgi:hypothetical protein